MLELIKNPNAMPTLITCLHMITSIRYVFVGDWGRVAYWVCAAGITASVTWGVK